MTLFQSLPEPMQERLNWLAHMRQSNPIYFDPETQVWHVFRYADVLAALHDFAHFSSENAYGTEESPISTTLLATDPPRHRQLRSLVSQAFTPRTVSRLAPRIQTIVEDLIQHILPAGEVEVVDQLAFPLPAIVIAELLGVPSQDRSLFQQWSEAIVVGTPEQGKQAMHILHDYFVEQLQVRRQHPQDDLMSMLLTVEIDGAHLTEWELVGFCQLLLIAGHETTTKLISAALLCFDGADLVDPLRSEPDLMPRAVEEVLRYLPPAWMVPRYVREEVQLGGRRLLAGAHVSLWLASANRDEMQFADPDTFRLDRENNRHLSFGHSIHTCLGAPLARLEATVALPLILQAFQIGRAHV